MDVVKARRAPKLKEDATNDWLLEGMQHLLRQQPQECWPNFYLRNIIFQEERSPWQV